MSCEFILDVSSLQSKVHGVSIFYKILVDVLDKIFHRFLTADADGIVAYCLSRWHGNGHTVRSGSLFCCSQFGTQYKRTIFESVGCLAIRQIACCYFHWKFYGNLGSLCYFVCRDHNISAAGLVIIFCSVNLYFRSSVHYPVRNSQTKLHLLCLVTDFQSHGVTLAEITGLFDGVAILFQDRSKILVYDNDIVFLEVNAVLQFCKVFITGSCTAPEVAVQCTKYFLVSGCHWLEIHGKTGLMVLG